MKDLSNFFLLLCWRQAGALGIMVAGIVCALPVVVLYSWLSDPPSPAREVQAAAVASWTARVTGFRYDPTRGLIATVVGPAGDADIMFSGIDTPLCDHHTPMEALDWLQREVRPGTVVTVYVVEPASPLFPMRGHLIVGNQWLNGSLVERGLEQLARHSPIAKYNAGRSALRQLQTEAQVHRRGLWRPAQ